MKRYLIAALFALPSVMFSQAIPFEQRGPIASLTASASYINGEPQNGVNHTLWGWAVSPEIHLTRQFGMQADFASYYMSSIYPGQSRLLMAAGPKYNFVARHNLTPFVFGEGGEMRLTFQKSLYRDWDPVAIAGVGVQYRISRSLAVTVAPEYIGHDQDNGQWAHDFTTRAGITFNLFR